MALAELAMPLQSLSLYPQQNKKSHWKESQWLCLFFEYQALTRHLGRLGRLGHPDHLALGMAYRRLAVRVRLRF